MAPKLWQNEVATDRHGHPIPGILKRTSPDGAVQYQVRVRLRGHPSQSASFDRLTDARRWMEATRTAVREGRHFKPAPAQRHTLAEAIDRYAEQILPQKRASTVSTQAKQLTWWRARLGERFLTDLTPAVLGDARDSLLREPGPTGLRSNATVVRYLAVLSHVLTVAQREWGWMESNPARSTTRPREPRGRVRFLSPDERDRLLEVCRGARNPFLYPVIVLALSTGMRQGEIMGLRWADVDLERQRVVLHETKNGERRAVPLVGPALDAVRALGGGEPGALLFPSKIDPSAPMDLRTPWETALKHARITDFRFHDLRHTAASYLAMSGASLAEIAEVLGHKTLEMVKRYAHLSEGHTAAVLERMSTKFLT